VTSCRTNRNNRLTNEFSDTVENVMMDVFVLITRQEASLYGAQVVMLKNVGSWIVVIREVFSIVKVGELIKELLKMTPYATDKVQKNVEKLSVALEAVELLGDDIQTYGLSVAELVPSLLEMLPTYLKPDRPEEIAKVYIKKMLINF